MNDDDVSESFVLAEHALFEDFAYLDKLKAELSHFLMVCDLPTAVCDEDACWFRLLEALSGVIEDGSLTCASKDLDKLSIINKVTFEKGRPTEGGLVPFGIKWTTLLKDNRTLNVEVGTTKPTRQNMWWGLKLNQSKPDV